MRVLLEEPRVFLSYGSAAIVCQETLDDPAPDAPWADESNGLCGAGVPGRLELQIATHTGWVPFRIELHDTEPALDATWEEVVEVSFNASSRDAHLTGLMGDDFEFPLPPGAYRVRYCARGFEDARTADEPPDSYLLQLWPGPPAPGRILKQTGHNAAGWHRARRTLTAEEHHQDDLATAAELTAQARERWGDREPNERLRGTLGAGLYLDTVSKLDMELEFALAELDDQVHRQVAAWAALRCLEESGLIGLTAISPAVAALRRGDPAPPPFDEPSHCWKVLEQARPPRTSVPAPPDGEYDQSPQDWAITTLFHSAERDSLVAVLEILVCLAFVYGRDDYQAGFLRLREHFPAL